MAEVEEYLSAVTKEELQIQHSIYERAASSKIASTCFVNKVRHNRIDRDRHTYTENNIFRRECKSSNAPIPLWPSPGRTGRGGGFDMIPELITDAFCEGMPIPSYSLNNQTRFFKRDVFLNVWQQAASPWTPRRAGQTQHVQVH